MRHLIQSPEPGEKIDYRKCRKCGKPTEHFETTGPDGKPWDGIRCTDEKCGLKLFVGHHTSKAAFGKSIVAAPQAKPKSEKKKQPASKLKA